MMPWPKATSPASAVTDVVPSPGFRAATSAAPSVARCIRALAVWCRRRSGPSATSAVPPVARCIRALAVWRRGRSGPSLHGIPYNERPGRPLSHTANARAPSACSERPGALRSMQRAAGRPPDHAANARCPSVHTASGRGAFQPMQRTRGRPLCKRHSAHVSEKPLWS
mgnify:CR=1 FL=1